MTPRLRDRKRARLHVREDMYNHALYWILRERRSMGQVAGRRAKSARLSGWVVIRLIAEVHSRTAREVAADLIERYEHHREC